MTPPIPHRATLGLGMLRWLHAEMGRVGSSCMGSPSRFFFMATLPLFESKRVDLCVEDLLYSSVLQKEINKILVE